MNNKRFYYYPYYHGILILLQLLSFICFCVVICLLRQFCIHCCEQFVLLYLVHFDKLLSVRGKLIRRYNNHFLRPKMDYHVSVCKIAECLGLYVIVVFS